MVYVMGRMTPTQQSNLIDVANTTVGVTELVLLTTIVDDRGVKINDDDIMYENNMTDTTGSTGAPVAQEAAINATPIVVTEDGTTVNQSSSSPYIDLYKNQ